MSTPSDSLSRKALAAASPLGQVAAAFFGREGLAAFEAGAFEIAVPFMLGNVAELERKALAVAEAKQKAQFKETPETRATERLYFVAALLGDTALAEMKRKAEAALLAVMEEAAQKRDGDRLRQLAAVIELVSKPWHAPLRAFLLSLKHRHTAKAKTAKQVSEALVKLYNYADGGLLPTLKNIREVAAEVGYKLATGKRGAPKGKPHKKPEPQTSGFSTRRK